MILLLVPPHQMIHVYCEVRSLGSSYQNARLSVFTCSLLALEMLFIYSEVRFLGSVRPEPSFIVEIQTHSPREALLLCCEARSLATRVH